MKLLPAVTAVYLCGTLLHAQSGAPSIEQAREHVNAGRFEEGVVAYRSVIAVDSTNPGAWRGLATALHRLERYPEALSALDRALVLNPNDFAIRFNRGLTLSELGRFAEAVVELEAGQRLRPDFAPGWTELGAAKALAGRAAESSGHWDRALALNAEYIWTRFYRGIAAVAAGDYRAAAEDLDAVAMRETLLSAHLWRWVAHRLDGRPAPSLRTTEVNWPSPVAAYLRGDITDAGLLVAARVVELPLDDRRLASAWFYIGVKQLTDGNREGARLSFNRALEQNAPRHAELVAAAALLARMDGRVPPTI